MLLQQGQLSGDLKLKSAGGCKWTPLLAIVLHFRHRIVLAYGFDHGLEQQYCLATHRAKQ